MAGAARRRAWLDQGWLTVTFSSLQVRVSRRHIVLSISLKSWQVGWHASLSVRLWFARGSPTRCFLTRRRALSALCPDARRTRGCTRCCARAPGGKHCLRVTARRPTALWSGRCKTKTRGGCWPAVLLLVCSSDLLGAVPRNRAWGAGPPVQIQTASAPPTASPSARVARPLPQLLPRPPQPAQLHQGWGCRRRWPVRGLRG